MSRSGLPSAEVVPSPRVSGSPGVGESPGCVAIAGMTAPPLDRARTPVEHGVWAGHLIRGSGHISRGGGRRCGPRRPCRTPPTPWSLLPHTEPTPAVAGPSVCAASSPTRPRVQGGTSRRSHSVPLLDGQLQRRGDDSDAGGLTLDVMQHTRRVPATHAVLELPGRRCGPCLPCATQATTPRRLWPRTQRPFEEGRDPRPLQATPTRGRRRIRGAKGGPSPLPEGPG